MSASSKSDLRSSAREQQRGIAQKAKWARGVHPTVTGRASSNPRPIRVSDTVHSGHRIHGSAIKSAQAVTNDMHSAASRTEWSSLPVQPHKGSPTGSEASDASALGVDDMVLDGEIAQPGQELLELGGEEKGPATGNTVLHSALSKALQDYEDRETAKLVKTEWSVLDDAGEEMGLSPVKGGRGARRPAGKERALSFEGEWAFV